MQEFMLRLISQPGCVQVSPPRQTRETLAAARAVVVSRASVRLRRRMPFRHGSSLGGRCGGQCPGSV